MKTPSRPRKKPKATRPLIEARLANIAKARENRWHGQGASDAMIEANRRSAQLSTGPRTEEGKAATCRNGWKHGRNSRALKLAFSDSATASMATLFGKPCLRSCQFHPDNPAVVKPCSLVEDGLTRAGGSCLDKTVYVNALVAISNALENGQMEGVHAMLAAEGAKVMQLLQQLTEEISKRGVLIPIPAVNKHGEVVREEDGSIIAMDMKLNPALPAFQKLLSDFGISLPEMLATPAARERAKSGKQTADALSTLMGQISGRAGAPRPALDLTELPDLAEE